MCLHSKAFYKRTFTATMPGKELAAAAAAINDVLYSNYVSI